MTWTKQPPTNPGWYWFKHPEHKIWITEVIWTGSRFNVRFEWGWMPLTSAHKESLWAGPIEEPSEQLPFHKRYENLEGIPDEYTPEMLSFDGPRERDAGMGPSE